MGVRRERGWLDSNIGQEKEKRMPPARGHPLSFCSQRNRCLDFGSQSQFATSKGH